MYKQIKPKSLLDCSDCRVFDPLTAEQLCQKGNCHKDYPIIKEVSRYHSCEFLIPVEGDYEKENFNRMDD